MVEFTAERVKEHAESILERFQGGDFHWSDLIDIVPEVMAIVQQVGGMTGPEKQTAAEAILDYIIDETNIPWLPDKYVDPICKKGVRKLVPMLINAAKGKFNID